MLPKINCLKKNKEFERVFKKGQSFKEDFLILKAVPNNLKDSRFGFIVSSKVSKKAVIRNKIKRWLRAAILLKLKRFDNIKESADIVMIVKPEINIKGFQEVQKTIDSLLKSVFNKFNK